MFVSKQMKFNFFHIRGFQPLETSNAKKMNLIFFYFDAIRFQYRVSLDGETSWYQVYILVSILNQLNHFNHFTPTFNDKCILVPSKYLFKKKHVLQES